jgi:hypothetical protein
MKQYGSNIYGINILLTAMVAGLMFYYSFFLGGYYDFLLENNYTEGLSVYISQYRESLGFGVSMPLLILQLIIAALALIFNFKKKLLPGLILALLAPVVLMILHFGTGFSYTEDTIIHGSDLSPENIEFFLKVNVPYHITYMICYVIAALWLIFQKK